MTVDQETASDARATQHRATLPALLTGWAETLGDQPAFTCVEPGGVSRSWSFRELDTRVSTVAAMLAGRLNTGARVALLASQGLEYAVGFLGALRAGVITVPLFPPGRPGGNGGLRTVLGDCRPALALTTRADQRAVTEFVGPYLAVVAVEDIPAAAPRDWPEPDPQSVAYLRYNPGSAGSPAGVTHADVVANARQNIDAYDPIGGGPAAFSWLPL